MLSLSLLYTRKKAASVITIVYARCEIIIRRRIITAAPIYRQLIATMPYCADWKAEEASIISEISLNMRALRAADYSCVRAQHRINPRPIAVSRLLLRMPWIKRGYGEACRKSRKSVTERETLRLANRTRQIAGTISLISPTAGPSEKLIWALLALATAKSRGAAPRWVVNREDNCAKFLCAYRNKRALSSRISRAFYVRTFLKKCRHRE